MTPDLDRYMAEKLMGWEQMTFPKFLAQYNQEPYTNHYCDELVWVTSDYQIAIPGSIVWHPTQSIAQAVMCLEKVKEREFSQRYKFIKALEKIIAKDHPELYSGEVITGLWNLFYLKPEHICKAIYAALEGE